MPTRPLTRDQMWLLPPSLDEMIPEDHVVRFVAANVPMLWLLGRQHPDHSTLARFLQKNRQAMKGLFKGTVCTAVEVAPVDLAFQAIDGTRVGNVSRDKALNEKLERVLVEMEQEIEKEEEEGAGDAHRMPEALPAAQARPETSVSQRCLCVSSGERQLSLSGGTDPSAGISDASEDKSGADSASLSLSGLPWLPPLWGMHHG